MKKVLFISFVILILIAFIWFVLLKQDFGNIYVLSGIANINLTFPIGYRPTIYSCSFISTGNYTWISTIPDSNTTVSDTTVSNTTLAYKTMTFYLIKGAWYINGGITNGDTLLITRVLFPLGTALDKYYYIKSGDKSLQNAPADFVSDVYTIISARNYNTTPWALTKGYYIYDYSSLNAKDAKINKIGNPDSYGHFSVLGLTSPQPPMFVINPSSVLRGLSVRLTTTPTTLPISGVNNNIVRVPTMVAIYTGNPQPTNGLLTSQIPYTTMKIEINYVSYSLGSMKVFVLTPPTSAQTYDKNGSISTISDPSFVQFVNISGTVVDSDIYLVSTNIMVNNSDSGITNAMYSDDQVTTPVSLAPGQYIYINNSNISLGANSDPYLYNEFSTTNNSYNPVGEPTFISEVLNKINK